MKMIKILHNIIFFIIVIGIVAIPASIMAHGVDFRNYRDDDRPDKVGVLVIALVPQDVPTATKQEYLDERIKETFPGLAVHWAYFDIDGDAESAFVAEGERMSPKMRLDQMEEDGTTHVAILVLSIIPSEAYGRLAWMVETLQKMPTKFRKITLARPFYGAPEDIRETCKTVLRVLPEHSGKGEAIVLFFEEQSRLGDYIYPGIQYYFWQLDKRVFVGTAGTAPGIQDVTLSLKESKADRVYLIPFLPYESTALALWKKQLEDKGCNVEITKPAVVGEKAITDVMVSRLRKALNELDISER